MIQNALDARHEVTTHEAPITQSGWTGSGYTFDDPVKGAGDTSLIEGRMGVIDIIICGCTVSCNQEISDSNCIATGIFSTFLRYPDIHLFGIDHILTWWH